MNERLQVIHAAIQFIEDHLREPVTVADIAAAAGYSLYHFIRTFNQTVQHTPYDYLMRRRLSEAARELLGSERRVIDIALDYQFNNHETFTRAFGRVFGMPPTSWQDQGLPDSRLLMPAFDLDYLEVLSAPGFEAPKLAALDEIILAGWMAPLSADPQIVPQLWQNLRVALRGVLLNSKPRDFWGIRIQPQISGGTSFYFAAAKIPSLESAPALLVTKILPAGDYVCLSQRNPIADFNSALKYLYHTFLPKSGLSLADPFEIEHFEEPREILIPVHVPQNCRIYR